MLVVGPDDRPEAWDQQWRRQLVENLQTVSGQLWRVGVTAIYIDGSFVETKDHPNDIDGYFECDILQLMSGDLQRSLNLLDPHKVWTWDPSERRPMKGHPKKELPMWHQYRMDLYPHYGQMSGLADSMGRLLTFADAFRLSKHCAQPRGIVRLKQG